MSTSITSETCGFCYLDLDIDNGRSKLATAAAFVYATDSRYGFSSKDLRQLGGSELSRIPELIATDHEWSTKSSSSGILTKPSGNGGCRIIVKLFWNVAPLACENFATLCASGGTSLTSISNSTTKPKPAPMGECGKPLMYRGSIIHRVIPGFVMQGGDFVFGNGSGGESIFGGSKKCFKDEKAGLQLKHDRRGVLSMGNSGKNSNTSQFFLTFDKIPQCDGKHVIFGELISGMQILNDIEKMGTSNGEPSVPIVITACGIYHPLETPGCGYWYDTPDPDSYTGISPVFMVRPRVIVVAPTLAVVEKFTRAMGSCVSIVASMVVGEEEGHVNTKETKTKIVECLGSFAADVVMVAPACKSLLTDMTELPKSWQQSGIALKEVILEAKPVEALSKIRSESWLSLKRPQWQLDGKP